MMLRLLALIFSIWASTSAAQTCPTRPAGDNTNACASTAFVTQAPSLSDVYFGSGRPWCDIMAKGAVPDGVTASSAAVTACITELRALGGGIVFVPPGSFNVCSVLIPSTSQSIWIVGAAEDASRFFCYTANTNVITMEGARTQIKNMSLISAAFSTANAVVAMGNAVNCLDCLIDHVVLQGGYYAVDVQGASDSQIIYTEFNQEYGTAQIRIGGSGQSVFTSALWLYRDQIDYGIPVQTPIFSNFKTWTATTAFSKGDVITVTSGGINYYLQCFSAGTSGSSQPAPDIFSKIIQDGSAQWLFWEQVAVSAVRIDSNVSNVFIQNSDISGSYGGPNILVTNAVGGGVGASPVFIDHNTIAGGMQQAIQMDAGEGDHIDFNSINSPAPYVSTPNGVWLDVNFGGNTDIIGNTISGFNYDVILDSGAGDTIAHNSLYGAATCMRVSAGVSGFTIDANQVGTSSIFGTCTYPWVVTTGGSNNYIITNNNGVGATNAHIDGGSGVSKTVSGNLN